MHDQIEKYLSKLVGHGLVEGPQDACLYALDDELFSNRPQVPKAVRALFDRLNINGLIVAKPEETRWSIMRRLAETGGNPVTPSDSESVTFLHDIPVVGSLHSEDLFEVLARRKGCIVEDAGVVATGTVCLEQAFVTFSSICFATFVKYFADLIGKPGDSCALTGRTREDRAKALKALETARPKGRPAGLADEIPSDEAGIVSAMDRAGKEMVRLGLVDSFFGNISIRTGGSISISQTGASLDELQGCIDRACMDGSSSCEITSSSELFSHVRIYELTGARVILHGHPRCAVILSLAEGPIPFGETRYVLGVPVVSGEVGAGSRGIVHTLPAAMEGSLEAIVAGHGVFAASRSSVREAFERLLSVENRCYEECARRIKAIDERRQP
ncbi:MAG TPA: class II aldolase/adducin family protein [Deltaproteobacteria bacterium]|nr:class II aldolase/adducin family protein [Deltaproteobacteria bacterium]HPP81372.1 class II aldolase/adducin family protein [Deltaproteobacteria bacterium]